ncbi:MAG: hypothetical protein IPH96_11485 [Saprospiraceae bacterium]|nr:hypothetical protein [Saprospiraceae bacterium]
MMPRDTSIVLGGEKLPLAMLILSIMKDKPNEKISVQIKFSSTVRLLSRDSFNLRKKSY